ncbi:MAG: Gfo/Idh/MocA family oxidoreductase [Pseudomonadota bacterium]
MLDLVPPIRVAVIGAGYFGRFHHDAWSRMPEVTLAAVCERDPERARAVAEDYGAPGQPLPVFSDVRAMLEAVQPDLVDITAPPAAHLPLLEALVPKVGHIICQKPFCGGFQGASEAVALAARHGTRIAVHENIRFQPWNEEAKRLLDAGLIGTPWQVSFRLRPGDGQGPDAYLDRQPYFQQMPRFLVHETAVHWIDTFRFLLGEVTGVFARLRRLNPAIAGEDAGQILFDFEGGAQGHFDGNRLSDHIAENRRRTLGEMALEGPLGTLRLDGEGQLWHRAFGENTEREQRFEWRDHLFGGDCVYRCNRAILEDWMTGRESPMEAQRYIRNQEIEEAIYRSAEEGRFLPV